MSKEAKSVGILSNDMKEVITASPFIALVSVSQSGEPHLIVVGKAKRVEEDSRLVFGVYKMDKTRENLAATGRLQAAVVSGKVGYRFTGTAVLQNDEVIFSVQQAATLL